ncbi:MAG: MBL fold metallo-hydrolase [Planctomycetes bacterium]|nr:MBL fold metallo-hydrolase [Planctomycetota bacterium]
MRTRLGLHVALIALGLTSCAMDSAREREHAPPITTTPWIHGVPEGVTPKDTPIEVRSFGPDTFVLRQSKSVHFEAPFLFLLCGGSRALLLDTGATCDAAKFPLRATVERLLEERRVARGDTAAPLLIVAHTHAHGDHVAGDRQFQDRPNTTIVGRSAPEVAAFFEFLEWPRDLVTFDLGERELTLLGIPGHEDASIAIFDERTGWLLTGDTVYPGRLYVRDWAAFKASVHRLARFARTHDVAWVVGTHVEMSTTPGVDFAMGATYQPNEHALELAPVVLDELEAALDNAGESPTRIVRASFIVEPVSR